MEYGLQMYSVRDITGKDLKGALKQVADIGYKYVEFAGFFGHEAKEVKGWLDEFGLTASGTHTGINPLLDDFEGTVKYHKAIGCPTIIIPGADLSSQEKLDAFVKNVNGLIPKLADEGITLDGEAGTEWSGTETAGLRAYVCESCGGTKLFSVRKLPSVESCSTCRRTISVS